MQPLKNNKYRIFKSRYDSIDSYLSCCGEKYNDIDLTIDGEIYKQLLGAGKLFELCKYKCLTFGCTVSTVLSSCKAELNYLPDFFLKSTTSLSSHNTFCYIKELIIRLLFTGIDKLLAQHIAHLFIRDPLSVFSEKIHLDDENESDHFEVRIVEGIFQQCFKKEAYSREETVQTWHQCHSHLSHDVF